MHGRLFETRQVTKNILVILITKAIASPIRGKGFKVYVRVGLFNVIDLESKIVCLINNKGEIFVIEILWRNNSSTGILFNSDLWFFDDTNSVTKVSNFTKVVAIGDVFTNTGLTERILYLLAIDNWREVTVRKVTVTSSG